MKLGYIYPWVILVQVAHHSIAYIIRTGIYVTPQKTTIVLPAVCVAVISIPRCVRTAICEVRVNPIAQNGRILDSISIVVEGSRGKPLLLLNTNFPLLITVANIAFRSMYQVSEFCSAVSRCLSTLSTATKYNVPRILVFEHIWCTSRKNIRHWRSVRVRVCSIVVHSMSHWKTSREPPMPH